MVILESVSQEWRQHGGARGLGPRSAVVDAAGAAMEELVTVPSSSGGRRRHGTVRSTSLIDLDGGGSGCTGAIGRTYTTIPTCSARHTVRESLQRSSTWSKSEAAAVAPGLGPSQRKTRRALKVKVLRERICGLHEATRTAMI